MDTKRLDKLAESLQDTGKRNNLINFKDTKVATVEVLFPSREILFDKIDRSSSWTVFNPQLADADEDDVDEESNDKDDASEALAEKEAFLARYSGKLKNKNQILLYNASKNPLVAVKNICKKEQENIEETGVNVVYMAFGFIHWKESESSKLVFRAPILLVPIHLESTTDIGTYRIKTTEDDIVVNPTFSYKMDAEYGVRLPDYNDEGLAAYIEKVKRLVAKLHWTVTLECKIGLFSFYKINMYRDLKGNAANILANRNVSLLLGESLTNDNIANVNRGGSPVADPLIELHSVVDADSSQIEAIEMAKSGKSFVLQGPPGTGKSQTITNIIAECLSDGKKVLFVSEKLAALNVVYDKLKQAGLSEFCLEIHSYNANKKDVIADIYHTLRADKSAISSKADGEIEDKKRYKRQLDAYEFELHKQRPVIDKSLYQMYDSVSALRSMPDVDWVVPQIAAKGDDYLKETSWLLEQYVDYIPSIGYDYRKNFWYGYINQDSSYQTKLEVKSNIEAVVSLLQKLTPLLREVSEKYGINCSSIEDSYKWHKFFKIVASSRLITPSLLYRENFEAVNSVLKNLQAQSTDILSLRSRLDKVFYRNIYKIDGVAYYQKLTMDLNSRLSRFGNPEYKNIIEELCACRQDSEKPSYDEAVEMLELLAEYQKKCALYYEAEASIKAFLGSAYTGIETDWNYLTAQMKKLQSIFADNIFFGRLTLYADFVSESNNFADYARRFEAAFIGCNDAVISQIAACFDKSVLDITKADCSAILARFNNCLNELDKLDNWNHFRALLSNLNDKQVISYIDIVIGRNLEPRHIVGAFRKLFYSQWIDCILAESPVLSGFNRIAHDKAIRVFAEKDTEQFEINKAKIRAELSARRPNTAYVAPGSPWSVLLREGEKKRKQKSIRKLLSEVGEEVQVVKPCFLMSPLSVSTFLPIDSVHFDVVIFDEASQIFPQDAIGAIYRAKQLIVVGDSKQMPPSNFFNSSLEVEDNDEETGDITDFESILDLCSTSMQQIRLRWHYRSRCEQLIAFSNKNFYDNELITFPSSQADAVGMGVDYYHVDGVFDRKSRTNRKEAEFVVELIYQNIEKYPNRSLGVIAFSKAQQTLIDNLLSKRRQSMPEKEQFFHRNDKEPFFVKNLETVQGDERDTIIFSVAYGVDTQGRLLYNFGPLNQIGGERRLNVAVTRAKYNIQLVSSMHYTDIDLTHTSAVGAKLLREYLDFAENGNIALERALSVNTFDRFDSDFELEVCDFLRSKGFAVDTQVGCSGFRIDLGLKKPDSSDYVLAIECDGATYHSSKNARDRDRLRQEILERMGWRFYRIWSTDWFRNKSDEQFRLLAAAQEAINNPIIAAEKPVSSQQQEIFEEVAEENHFEFPPYQAADIQKISRKHSSGNFKGIIKAILEVEAPLSEELLLKRMLWYFHREKVTSVVLRDYEQQMSDCQSYGIIRKNGFLYLDNGKEIKFRTPGDIERDIKHIAPEELAAGMLEIIKQNIAVDKEGLYRLMASQCGVNRVGKAANEALDSALYLLEDSIEECDHKIKLKEVKNCINEDDCGKRESEQLSQLAKADVTLFPSASDNGFLVKPTESELANNNINKHNVANKTKKESSELIRTLADSQFMYIDNRSSSGILWVLYVADKSEVFEEILADYDVHYTLEKRGSLATKKAPAWRVMFN